MARKLSAREQVLNLSQRNKQADIARRLGVSTRTIRRWKNEGVEPTPEHSKTLARVSTRERANLDTANRRLSHGRQPVPRAAVVPVGERRILKVYRDGKHTGQYQESAWINYDVESLTYRDVYDMVRGFRNQFLVVQFIYDANKDDPGVTGRFIVDRKGKVLKIRGVSVPQDMSAVQTDADVADLLAEYYPPSPRKLLWFAVHDRVKGWRRRR